jgi:hypothetical protein
VGYVAVPEMADKEYVSSCEGPSLERYEKVLPSSSVVGNGRCFGVILNSVYYLLDHFPPSSIQAAIKVEPNRTAPSYFRVFADTSIEG